MRASDTLPYLYRLLVIIERSNGEEINAPFARWRHFTTTTRILYVFPFIFKFGNPSEVYKTKALICTRKQNPEGFVS